MIYFDHLLQKMGTIWCCCHNQDQDSVNSWSSQLCAQHHDQDDEEAPLSHISTKTKHRVWFAPVIRPRIPSRASQFDLPRYSTDSDEINTPATV